MSKNIVMWYFQIKLFQNKLQLWVIPKSSHLMICMHINKSLNGYSWVAHLGHVRHDTEVAVYVVCGQGQRLLVQPVHLTHMVGHTGGGLKLKTTLRFMQIKKKIKTLKDNES